MKLGPAICFRRTPDGGELEAANVPANLDEVDIAAINSNYALGAGLNPVEDALVIEAADRPMGSMWTPATLTR